LIIKKNDINSIFPTIIKIIKLIFELVNKLEKSILFTPYNADVDVFVRVKIESLKELSKFVVSISKTPESINTLIKKEIKIRKDNFMFVLVIFLSENNIF